MPLQRNPAFQDPDRIYNAIIDAHRGLSDADSLSLNARLVLLLANHIGDEAIVHEAIAMARGAVSSKT
ncbi:MAG: DUF2783 domain-containing protein [Hyphomicrobiaceae bacterium]